MKKSGTRAALGTPAGIQLARYLRKPLARTPSMWYETQTISVSVSGIEMFAVAA